jgi:phosphoesterase RecJ-like protein
MNLYEIVCVLKKADNIAIFPHISVDGDGLGSSLALGLALKKLHKKVAVYLEESIPEVYSFLPGNSLVEVYGGSLALYEAGQAKASSGIVAVALDTGDLDRLGKRAGAFNRAQVRINIDHHATNPGFADYNFIKPESSAVGEIVFEMIGMMEVDMDRDIAICLYTAITTDTGGFRYSNTTPLTHRIAADLVGRGINVADISQKVFDTTSLEKTKLIGMAIGTLELYGAGKLAIITIDRQMMEDSGAKDEDCDGIVNIGRNIKGVEVAVLMREADNREIRVNLRSNYYVDVSVIANLFSGGGHKRAAGFTVVGELSQVKSQLVQIINKVL